MADLLATVQAVKDVAGRRTLVVDAGMQTLLRPALYDAYHRVAPLRQAEDALLLDTTELNLEQSRAKLLELVRSRIPELRGKGATS